MRRLLPLLLALSFLSACASVPLPRTPSQGVFAVQSAYIAAAHAQTNYLRSPYSTPEAAAVIQRLDAQAYAALVPGALPSYAALDAPGPLDPTRALPFAGASNAWAASVASDVLDPVSSWFSALRR